MIYNDIKDAVHRFAFEGEYLDAIEMHSGNVNATYHLFFRSLQGERRDYVLQQINVYAFHEPEKVMDNIVRVTEHLRRGQETPGASQVLTCIPMTTGGFLYHDQQDRYWRAYYYIDGATAYDKVERPEHFYEVGRAFGDFQRQLSDFSATDLYDTIPDFHNTKRRFYAFVASIAENKAGRLKGIEKEVDFLFDHRKMMNAIVDRIEDGRIPVRVTHNDTKVNNVMLDNETGRAVCVIDLDTVMAGSALYDYGDAIRYGASTAVEDEPDLDRIHIDLELFESFTKGYLEKIGDVLVPEELRLMPLSILIMTCELAMRFLKDYIDGDQYFRVRGPEHNLVRARAQMQLLRDMEQNFERLCSTTNAMIRQIMGEEKMVQSFIGPWDRH